MGKRKLDHRLKVLVAGGFAFLATFSLCGVGFASWLITSQEPGDETSVVISVGAEEKVTFDLDKNIVWDISFPMYNSTYGFFDKSNSSYSSTLTILAKATLWVNDSSNEDFYNYYEKALGSPDTFSFYSRMNLTSRNETNYVDLSTDCTNVQISYQYTYSSSTSEEIAIVNNDRLSTSTSDMIENKLVVDLTSRNEAISTWTTLTFLMEYQFDFTSEVSAAISNSNTSLTNICEELDTSFFSAALLLEETYENENL